MAIKAKEMIEKIIFKYANYGTKCKSCNITLDNEITGLEPVSDGFVCRECYYEEWGRIVEEHPICSPKR